MAGVNFRGAKYFSINGGNFSEVGGNMNTYHINGAGGMPSAQAFSELPGVHESSRERKARLRQHYQQGLLPSASIRPVSESGSSGSSTTSSGGYRPATSWSPVASTTPSTQHVPISRASPSSSPARGPSSTMSAPAASTYHSPTGSNSSLGSDVSELGDNSVPSRYSTPDTSADETHLGPSIPPEQPLDQLSPLTNSLGLSRFTPANQFQPLVPPSEIATPRTHYPEIRNPSRAQSRASTYNPAQVTHTSMSSPPPPVLPRPGSLAGERELGPPPPVPPRPTFISPPPHHATPAPATPQILPSTTPALSDIEDPSARFARLQAQRQTKGYPSGLGENVTYTPSPFNAPRALPPPPQTPGLDANPEANFGVLQRTFTHRNDLQIYPTTPSSTICSPTSPPPIAMRPLPSVSPTPIPSVLGSPEPSNAAPQAQGQTGWISNWAHDVRPGRSERDEGYPAPAREGFTVRRPGEHPPHYHDNQRQQIQQPQPPYQHQASPFHIPASPAYPQYSPQWGPPSYLNNHPNPNLSRYSQQQHPPQGHYQNRYEDQGHGYPGAPFSFPAPSPF